MSELPDAEALKSRLEEAKVQHRELDDAIRSMQRDAVADPLQIQRMKKRKLQLKDAIAKLESKLRPEIIA